MLGFYHFGSAVFEQKNINIYKCLYFFRVFPLISSGMDAMDECNYFKVVIIQFFQDGVYDK